MATQVETIEDRVREVFVDTLDLEEDDITLEATLKELDIDSLSAVEVQMALEEEFELEDIPIEDLEKAQTFKDVVDYIESKIA